MRVDLHPEARAEFRSAALWYEERRDGLGEEFVVVLRNDTAREFVSTYLRDTSEQVRVEVVKGFALEGGGSPDINKILIDALDDPAERVREFAAFGVGRLQIQNAIPRIAELLHDPSPRIRAVSARSLGLYGARTAEYLTVLEQLALIESDPAARAEMRRAMENILVQVQRPR